MLKVLLSLYQNFMHFLSQKMRKYERECSGVQFLVTKFLLCLYERPAAVSFKFKDNVLIRY